MQLTYEQAMHRRSVLWEQLCSPSLEPDERVQMKAEYDELLSATVYPGHVVPQGGKQHESQD